MFKDQLAMRLKEVKMSGKALAQKMGYTQQAVSKWVTGNASPDIETLSKIADALDCTTDYLLGRVDYPEVEIRKAPPSFGGVIEYGVHKDSPDFTAEEIKELKQFLDGMKGVKNQGE